MVDVERHWPWFVLAAAVIANVLSGGVVRSYGIIYMDIRDRQETSSVETVVIAALALGISGLVAPLAQGWSCRFGCFLVTLFGSFYMCLGFLISAFLTKVYWHYITIGFLVGCGSGLVQVASVLAVLNVFRDRPVLVTAMISMSFPLGTFLFAFITRGLLDRFSYFGSFLILSAIMANCIVCGLFYRPYRSKKTVDANNASTYRRMASPIDEIERESDVGGTTSGDDVGDRDIRELGDRVEDETSRIHKGGTKHYKTVTGPTEEMVVGMDSDVITFDDYSVDDEVYVSSEDEEVTKPGGNRSRVVEKPHVEKSPVVVTTVTDEPDADIYDKPTEKPRTVLENISDPRTLCNWRFILLILAVLLYSMGFGVPLVCYPDLSREHEITDLRAVWPLAVIGVLSSLTVVVSEFSLPYVITNYPRTVCVLVAGSTIVGGVIIALAYNYSTFELLLLSAILFGVFSAPCRAFGTCNQIIRETTVTEDLLPFYIWGNVISGVGFLIGLPVSGVLHDMDGTYSWAFGFAGICFILSAVLSTFIVCHRREHVRLID